MRTPMVMTDSTRGRGRWTLLFVLVMCCNEAIGIGTSSYKRFVAVQQSNGADWSPKHDQQRIRRAKSTKGSESDSNDNDVVSSAQNGPQTLAAYGLQMTLGGVEPWDAEATSTWQGVTRDFIAADIWETQKKVKELDVNVYFVEQDPPFESRRNRVRRLLQESQLDITFHVDMVIESKEAASLNAVDLVFSAFDSEQKRAAYMEQLRSTGDPALAAATMESNVVSSTAAPSNGRKIGISLAVTILLLIIIAAVAYILHGNKTNAATTVVVPENDTTAKEAEEEESPPEAPRDVPSRSTAPRSTIPVPPQESAPIQPRNGIPQTIYVDDASTYFDGNVSVAWSMDTENQPTQISNLS